VLLASRQFLSSALAIGPSRTWLGTTDPGWQANVFRQSATALGVSDNDIVWVGPRVWGRRTIKQVERNLSMVEITRPGPLAGVRPAGFATSVMAPCAAHITQVLTELAAATPNERKTA
jgi:hypothetical protein